MKRSIAVAGLLLSSLALGATEEQAAIAAGGIPIAAAELERLYTEHVVIGTTPGGYRFETRVEPDGTIAASERRGPGRFWVERDGKACLQFADVWEGAPRCWTYYSVGEGIRMFREDGALAAEITTEPRR
jgi:hypothetical protein